MSSLTEQVSGDGLLLGVGIDVGTVGSQTPERRENPKVVFTSASEPEGTYARELSPRTMRFLQNTHSDINRNLLSAYRPISENFANQLTEHGFQPSEISSMTYSDAFDSLNRRYPEQTRNLIFTDGYLNPVGKCLG